MIIAEKKFDRIAGVMVDGYNYKRDQSKRDWRGVLTGRARKVKEYYTGKIELHFEIEENASCFKWLNFATFTGRINGKKFENGIAIPF